MVRPAFNVQHERCQLKAIPSDSLSSVDVDASRSVAQRVIDFVHTATEDRRIRVLLSSRDRGLPRREAVLVGADSGRIRVRRPLYAFAGITHLNDRDVAGVSSLNGLSPVTELQFSSCRIEDLSSLADLTVLVLFS